MGADVRVLLVSLVGLAAVACGGTQDYGGKTAATSRSSAPSRAVVVSPSPAPTQNPSPAPSPTLATVQPVAAEAVTQSGAILPDSKTAPTAAPTITINFIWKEGVLRGGCRNPDPSAPVQLAPESDVTFKSMKKTYAVLPSTTCQLETYPQRQDLKPGEYACSYESSNCVPYQQTECQEFSTGLKCTTPNLP